MQKLLLIFTLFSLLAGCAPNSEIETASSNVQLTTVPAQPAATKSLEDYRLKVGAPTFDALTATARTAIALSTPVADCPVTTPENVSFQAPAPHAPVAPWEGLFWYGTDGLWTALHTDGVWADLPRTSDGYTQKIMWWSDSFVLQNELEPALVVTGQRLDAKSEPLRFYGATNAMADDIGEAMLTGVEFPTSGCWEVRAEYKKSDLKFVVWIAP